jgi:hypothetical protein
MRLLILLSFLWLLIAAAPPLPDALKPYVHEGHLKPDDYGWMRGRFDDATPAERAEEDAIQTWLNTCIDSDLTERRAELRALGIVDAKLEQAVPKTMLCNEILAAPYPIDLHSFSTFQQAVRSANPIAEAYLTAVRQAKEIRHPDGPLLRDALLARALGEQMLRKAGDWGDSAVMDAALAKPDVKAIIASHFLIARMEEDRNNTEWLKDIVARQGWPKISEVGKAASRQAWLLVQHADADPAFQLKVLRLMEPLLPTGEVSRADFAYLYDRVMVKITGKQRYATQTTCQKGKPVLQPLEDEGQVNRLRTEIGLEPVSKYLKEMQSIPNICAS